MFVDADTDLGGMVFVTVESDLTDRLAGGILGNKNAGGLVT